MHSWTSASANVIYVDTYYHKYTNVAGNEIEKMPLTVSWKGTKWDSIMQITSNYGGTSAATEFIVAFQSIQYGGDKAYLYCHPCKLNPFVPISVLHPHVNIWVFFVIRGVNLHNAKSDRTEYK